MRAMPGPAAIDLGAEGPSLVPTSYNLVACAYARTFARERSKNDGWIFIMCVLGTRHSTHILITA